MKKTLLTYRKYKIIGEHNCKRVTLSPMCGFEVGQKVYQELWSDGSVRIIPAENLEDKND